MCGITGYISLNNHPAIGKDCLEKMVQTIHHRGPDELGMAIHKQVAMGMRRLSIIDLSSGSQPIYNENRQVWTVFNGEIYNFPQLRDDLLSKGHIFKTHTDTEVIVHAYEEYGSDFPKHLNGMMAIGLHDIQRKKFILARDHMGIKPLYYTYSDDYFIFGSEIKTILASGVVNRELNFDALGDFMAWEYVPGPQTLFKNIFKLPPANYLEIDLDHPVFESRAYWDIPLPNDMAVKLSTAEWEERVATKIIETSENQLISDVPLGAFLSGGVDSSLIVSAMGQAQTFSIGFDDPTYNELKWARRVADHLGMNHVDKIIRPEVLSLYHKLIYFLDDPIGDFSIFPTYLVSKLAREYVTVVLSGDGGDELFGGYETYIAENKSLQYRRIPNFLRRGLIEPLVNSLRPTTKKKGLINKAKRFIEGLNHPDDLVHARWRIFVGDTLRNKLFSNASRSYMNGSSSDHILRLLDEAGDRGHLDRGLYVDVKSYLVDNILTKVDRMSMAVSLEARVPFLDPELVKLAFNVPEQLKVHGGQTKMLLKKIASRYVPRECVYRPKEGFSIPIKNWLNTEFRPLVDELLDDRKIGKEGIFKPETVSQLKKEHQKGIANHSHILWSLIVFHSWKKMWLDGPLPEKPTSV